MDLRISQEKFFKLFKRAYRSCPGTALHEKIIPLPELLYGASEHPLFRDMALDAKIVADRVAMTQHRYLLDDEVAGAAYAVAETRGESLQRVLPHIRVPHRRMWIEFGERGRKDMASLAVVRLKNDDSIYPQHTAMMIESDDAGRRGMLEFCYADPKHGFVLYPFAFEFDLDNPFRNSARLNPNRPTEMPIWFQRDTPNVAGDMTRSWLEHVRVHQGARHAGREPAEVSYKRLIPERQQLIGDVLPEFRFLISALGMLSLRNGIRATAERVSPGLQKATGSLGRRLEMQTTTSPTLMRMTMALSRDPDRDRAQGRRHGNAPGRHWVCGHFKVRKTGVYWWSPHQRGDAARDLTEVPREIRVIRPPRQDPEPMPEP